LKKEAIRLAAFVLPEQVKVTIDGDYQVGLVSVSLQGHGRLHLPAGSVVSVPVIDHAKRLDLSVPTTDTRIGEHRRHRRNAEESVLSLKS
jgi:hypothetical protein